MDKGVIYRMFHVMCNCGCDMLCDWVKSKRAAARDAKEAGWKLTRKHGWQCPGCVQGIPKEDHKYTTCKWERRSD